MYNKSLIFELINRDLFQLKCVIFTFSHNAVKVWQSD